MILFWAFFHLFSQATIYGDNSLVEIGSCKPELIELSRAVAVRLRSGSLPNKPLDEIDAIIQLNSSPLFNKGVCEDELFASQPSDGSCTGFLVGPDLLLTAGHCIANQEDCDLAIWAFDHLLDSTGKKVFLHKDSLFHCKQLLDRSYDEFGKGLLDYSLIRISREFNERPHLTLDDQMIVNEKQNVVSISSPRGLPLKCSSGIVRDVSPLNYFLTNTDLMKGSSGAPLFDEKTLNVIGIFANGERDYEAHPTEICNIFKHCTDTDPNCRGEYATRISKVKAKIQKFLPKEK